MKVGIGSKNENERSVAFIVARLTSSRLPKKQLRMIGDRPLLLWIIDSLRNSKELDELVIATPAEKANEPLKKFAKAERISCFWYEGHADHVTTRLRKAAETCRADICVLISGDCPLVYAPAIDCLIRKLKGDPDADVIRIDPDGSGQSPATEGISVARRRAWRLADDLSDRPELKEHQFPIIRMHPEIFNEIECRLEDDLYTAPHRFSVDTLADLNFMNTVYKELHDMDRPFVLKEVLSLLKEKPDLRTINSHVYQRRLKEDIYKVLYLLSSDNLSSTKRLNRGMKLASRITEMLSWPVTFLIDDKETAHRLERLGFTVMYCERGIFSNPEQFDRSDRGIIKAIQSHNPILIDLDHPIPFDRIRKLKKDAVLCRVNSSNLDPEFLFPENMNRQDGGIHEGIKRVFTVDE